MSNELRIAHISDLHVPARWPLAPWHYLGKRLIGALNWQLKRRKDHPLALAKALAEDLAADPSIDHVVVTGDLTNVSLLEEFSAAREVLRPLIERGSGFLSAIPGNHDRYTYTSDRRRDFEASFHDCMTSDLDLGAPFPFVRFRGGVAILGIDSAVATLPFMATGTVGEEQRERLSRALEHPRVREASFRVALIHHPPLIEGGERDEPQHRL
ncbi:metallophosphoesterase, partial [bacterium]|nr:metallophosphoesterase [bacterium]